MTIDIKRHKHAEASIQIEEEFIKNKYNGYRHNQSGKSKAIETNDISDKKKETV